MLDGALLDRERRCRTGRLRPQPPTLTWFVYNFLAMSEMRIFTIPLRKPIPFVVQHSVEIPEQTHSHGQGAPLKFATDSVAMPGSNRAES